MSNPKCRDKVLEPAIIQLIINEKSIFLNEFVQYVLTGVNLSCFEHLKGFPQRDKIESFELNFTNEKHGKENPQLIVNGKKIGLNKFVQDLVIGYNIGIINTLSEIPENPDNFKIIYRKLE